MHSKLVEIVKNKEVEVAARKAAQPDLPTPQKGDGKFLAALQKSGTNLICEIKPKSPTAGVLQENFDLGRVLRAYDQYAAAISVLTDAKYFGGSLDLLKAASSESKLPTLCKDFIIDPYQCQEARLAGASAILLIVKILSDETMAALHAECRSLGLTAVVEVQNESEVERSMALGPEVILINNRNLDTFDISLETTAKLAPTILEDVVVISASGFSTGAEIASMSGYCHNFLIGSSLMAAPDMAAKLAELKSGGS